MTEATLFTLPGESPATLAWRRFRGNRVAWPALMFLCLIVGACLFGPLISPYSATTVSDAQFEPPSLEHWCGTDVHGRDVMTRILMGARVSMLVGIAGATVSLVLGVLWGAVAGYVGGRWDNLMMRFVDVLYSLPSILFVLVMISTLEALVRSKLAGILPGGAGNVRLLFLFAGLGAVSWLTMARIVRGQVLSLRQRAFVEAGLSLGLSHRRIILRHILPNLTGVIIVYLTLTLPSIILYESFLSYLGLGIQAPLASWGTLIAEGKNQINPVRIYWWLLAFPGALLVMTLLALNLVGDGLRDAIEPQHD